MRNIFKILTSVIALAIIFGSANVYALNESLIINLTEDPLFVPPDKNVSFEKENFTLPPPPEVDMPLPPGFNESTKINITKITPKDEQRGNDGLIKWYYFFALFLIPLLLFFLIDENVAVADADFLQQVKEDSDIFHKFKIYVTPRAYSELSKQNKNIIINLKTTHLNKKGKEYLDKYGDETLALAKQINARIILTGKDAKKELYEKHGFKINKI